ncbi:recombination directionality factor [Nitrospira sp. Kam-Ns4a]
MQQALYQIDIGSYNSIVDLNSGLDYVEALLGRVAMVPLVLTRVPRETFGGGQRRIHYPLQLTLATNDTDWINRLRTETAAILERQAAVVLPAPADENPALDDDAVVVPESDLPALAGPGSAPLAPPMTSTEPPARPTAEPTQPAAALARPAAGPTASTPSDPPSGPTGGTPPAPSRPPSLTPSTGPARPAAGPAQPATAGPARPAEPTLRSNGVGTGSVSPRQAELIRSLCTERGISPQQVEQVLARLDRKAASTLLDRMLKHRDYTAFQAPARLPSDGPSTPTVSQGPAMATAPGTPPQPAAEPIGIPAAPARTPAIPPASLDEADDEELDGSYI